jgi:hypothetical protein
MTAARIINTTANDTCGSGQPMRFAHLALLKKSAALDTRRFLFSGLPARGFRI